MCAQFCALWVTNTLTLAIAFACNDPTAPSLHPNYAVQQAVHRLSLKLRTINMHVEREAGSNVLSYAVIYDEFPAWPIVRFILGCGLSIADENAYKKLISLQLEGKKKRFTTVSLQQQS